MTYKYATQDKGLAKAVGTDLPISTKATKEICRTVKGKNVERARKILQDAAEKKKAIPYKTHNGDVGHKRGMGPGRYPIKASQHIMKIIDSAVANARFQGINTNNLIIKNILAQKGAETFKYGRQTRRRTKRTHVEVVLAEGAEKKGAAKKEEKKVEAKPAEKKETAKKEVVEKKTEPAVAEKKEVAEKPKTEPVKKEEQKPAVVEKKEVVKEEPKKESKTQDQKEKPEDKKQ